MAFGIGSNDGANSMADAVGSKAITVFKALVLAAICEFCGAVFVGSQVSNTIRKGIIDVQMFSDSPELLARGMVCALLASAIWLQAASIKGMPVSTTHSIVGAIFGFGLVFGGAGSVNWAKMGQIVLSWFISPLAGGLMSYLIFRSISKRILGKDKPVKAASIGVPIVVFVTFAAIILATIVKGLKNVNLDLSTPEAVLLSITGGFIAAFVSVFLMRGFVTQNVILSRKDQLARVEKIFVPLVILTSCSVAFAHGANDVSNAIGPIAAVFEIVRTGDVPKEVAVPMWILMLGGAGISAGILVYGRRVIRTVGSNITDLTPSRGVAADIATTITVLTCSNMGLPISTTHTLVGAVLGVGLARGITAINLDIVKPIMISWFVTVPFTAVVTVLLYALSLLVL